MNTSSPSGFEMFASFPDVMNTSQAAEALGCSDKSIRTLIRNGELRAIHIGRVLRVSKAELVRFCSSEGEGVDLR
jgi:excisionase family DNA binding protein